MAMADWRTVRRAVSARHRNPWSAWTRWTATGIAAMIAARRGRAVPTVLATGTQMALLLAYWELMARHQDRRSDVR